MRTPTVEYWQQLQDQSIIGTTNKPWIGNLIEPDQHVTTADTTWICFRKHQTKVPHLDRGYAILGITVTIEIWTTHQPVATHSGHDHSDGSGAWMDGRLAGFEQLVVSVQVSFSFNHQENHSKNGTFPPVRLTIAHDEHDGHEYGHARPAVTRRCVLASVAHIVQRWWCC